MFMQVLHFFECVIVNIWSRFIAWVGGFSIPFYKSTGNSPFDFKIFLLLCLRYEGYR